MEITGISYNWHQFQDRDEAGEVATHRHLDTQYGQFTVTKIEEHAAQGEGDRWYWDIHYSDNTIERIFNPNQVFYKK